MAVCVRRLAPVELLRDLHFGFVEVLDGTLVRNLRADSLWSRVAIEIYSFFVCHDLVTAVLLSIIDQQILALDSSSLFLLGWI